MPEIGQTVSHYRIVEKIGQGGMGEVYLADDTTLDRKVALKFLPEVFTGDPERMARFEREAKLLASLNHPNIAGIYGLEQIDGNRFLVLEYVEGETLQARLSKRVLSLDDVLALCRQIAEGLEAAHEKGVIHRDLKPANVMITAEEKVKILDFGLAKALADESQRVDLSDSPTITDAMTRPGVVLGTAAYMSPEQAKGKRVDKRADIWAFGCILYECLTGKKAFQGETVTETLASVIRGEPDWNALPNITPQNIRFLLRRCLEKERSRRFRDAADVQIEIEETRDIGETAKTELKWRSWLAWSVAAVFMLASAALSFIYFNSKSPIPAEFIQLKITLPDNASLSPEGSFAVSPDGRCLAFAALDTNGVNRIWIRELDSLVARPLPGTESKSNYIPPFFWSPDSRFIAFDAGGILKKVEISGRPPVEICDLPSYAIGGTWNRDGVIIYPTLGGGLMHVSETGGAATPLTKLNEERQEFYHLYPTFLPDGRHFLYMSISLDKGGIFFLCLGSLDAKPEEQGFKPLMETILKTDYVPSHVSDQGHILFLREQTLMAQPFDEKQLKLDGEPLFVADQVGSFMSFGFFSASTNGVLVYKSGVTNQWNRPTWFDRQGNPLSTAGESGQYYGLTLSPDGTQAAVGWRNMAQVPSFTDIYLLDFARDTNARRFTFGEGLNSVAVWSPDGSSIIFASDRDGGVANLYQKLSSGIENERLLVESNESKYPSSWSSDGRFVLFTVENPKTKGDLWVLPMEGDQEPWEFLDTEFNEIEGRFSENMHWIAYQSDESGRNEIYVRGFSQDPEEASTKTGGRWQISKGGGTGPRWSRDDKELYYHDPNGTIMVAEITPGLAFRSGTPKPLFQAPPDLSIFFTLSDAPVWDVTADGNRFLLQELAVESSSEPFTIVLNWTSLMKQ